MAFEKDSLSVEAIEEMMNLEAFVPSEIILDSLGQSDFPSMAKNPELMRKIEHAIMEVPTKNKVILGDSRSLSLGNESIHLVVTSPPYWTLKKYNETEGQLGEIEDYNEFIIELGKVWKNCHDAMIPGGRMVVVVGDVLLSRRKHGRHRVVPLHASIQEQCIKIGFDNLAPIIWYKIGNVSREAKGSGSFLGKPYEPNAIVKNNIEYILFFRKPGGYRQPTKAMRVLSLIPENEHKIFFQQIWNIQGASTRKHPAPYPLELAERLIRMFSFVGDTVLDPFLGTGTTLLAAAMWGRNGIGYEIDKEYIDLTLNALRGDLRFAKNVEYIGKKIT